jgi:hypothetical protein
MSWKQTACRTVGCSARFPPDFPPNSSIQDGKRRYRFADDHQQAPEFPTQRDCKIQDEIDGNSLGNRCRVMRSLTRLRSRYEYNRGALKPSEKRHRILRWFDQATDDARRTGTKIGDVYTAPMSGATRARIFAMQMPCRLSISAWLLLDTRKVIGKFGLLARPKRFELLTPRFVVWCSTFKGFRPNAAVNSRLSAL